jgi:hypothetical protein
MFPVNVLRFLRLRLTCVLLLGLALVLFAGSSFAQTPRPPCTLDLSVYGPAGNKLDFGIAGVTRADDNSIDFLTAPEEFRMVVDGSRLYFPKSAVNGLQIELTLEIRQGRGRRAVRTLPLLACEQQATVRYGQMDAQVLEDASVSSAEGRLFGCQLDGHWWIRATPMFGTPEQSIALQGYVRRSDGYFRIDFSEGVRLIVVVGKEKEPVKAFAVDVTLGAKNNLGDIDLSGSCPNRRSSASRSQTGPMRSKSTRRWR